MDRTEPPVGAKTLLQLYEKYVQITCIYQMVTFYIMCGQTHLQLLLTTLHLSIDTCVFTR